MHHADLRLGPRPGAAATARRSRGLPMPVPAKPNRPARPWSRNGMCYAV